MRSLLPAALNFRLIRLNHRPALFYLSNASSSCASGSVSAPPHPTPPISRVCPAVSQSNIYITAFLVCASLARTPHYHLTASAQIVLVAAEFIVSISKSRTPFGCRDINSNAFSSLHRQGVSIQYVHLRSIVLTCCFSLPLETFAKLGEIVVSTAP